MPTVTARYSQALLQASERLGLSVSSESDATDRVSLADQDLLWQQLVDASDDPLVGLRLGEQLQVGHLDVAGMLLMSCDTFGQSLEALVEYHPIVGEGGDFLLETGGEQARLVYQPVYDTCRAQRVEAVISAMIQLSRWSTGGAFAPGAVQLCHAALTNEKAYGDILGCPVTFEQAENALLFDPALLDLTLIQANANLREHLQTLANDMLAKLDDSSLAARVRSILMDAPTLGKERVGEQLAMSGRHLTRMLSEEGFSFRQLREQVLQTRAETMLKRGEKVTVIAETLGFADDSAFSKAFRRWSGMTPTQFRESTL